jgi:hypothetical protein
MPTLLQSLARKLVTRLHLVALAARLNLPSLASRLAWVMTRTIDTNSSRTVLCIGRPIFNEDIEEMSRHGGTLNYVVVPKAIFLKIFRQLAPELVLSHARYHEIHEHDDAKRRCRKFYEAFLRRFVLQARAEAILTANYNYSWQQELAAAARDLGIPFVVLFKEGISPLFAEGVSPQAAYDMLVGKYTNNCFIGDRLIVYNNRIKQGFANVPVQGITQEIVEAVGIPRFDRYFRLGETGSSIVFFSFNFEDKARHLGLAQDVFDQYHAKTREFHIEVLRFAAAHQQLRVIVKTKNNLKYLCYVQDIATDLGLSGLPNLTMTNQGDVFELIRDAHAVIGYNSTTLLEAFAARRIVMSADFRWGPVRDYFDEHPGLPNYVTTSQDMETVLARNSKGRPLDDPQLYPLLYERIHVPDGKASARAEAAITRAIVESRQGKAKAA